MGVWGSGLYENDSTCDVRDMYLDFLQDGLGNDVAYEKMLEQSHEYIGNQDEPLFWFALAETQWRVGRLRPDVKEKALEWIEKKGFLDMWAEDPKGFTVWEKTLKRLKEYLERPMPKEKKIPKLDQNPWNLHDVYAYQFHKTRLEENGLLGKYMLIQKIGEERYFERKKLFMQIQAIDHVFDELPELDDIKRYRILPLDDLRYIERRKFCMNNFISISKPFEYPSKYLTFLGTVSGQSNKVFTSSSIDFISWSSLEYYLNKYYKFWQGREYYEVEEGIYNWRI